MVSREEIYKIVSTFLDSNFEKDLANKKFYLKKRLTEDELNDVICTFANLLGNKITPMHDTNEIQHNFKIHSQYIEIDEKTIKFDEKGRLYVDVENFVNQDEVISKLMENQEFYNKIAEHFNPNELTMLYIKKFLLTDPEYLTFLNELLETVQKIKNGEVDSTALANKQRQLGIINESIQI
jgi:hypothetical protein